MKWKKKCEKEFSRLEFELERLLVNQLKHESKMRKESQRLSKKRQVGYIT